MNHTTYNRKRIEHILDLMETAEMEQWLITFSVPHIQPPQGLEAYADGQMLTLDLNPVACRNLHVGEATLSFNMSIRGQRIHLSIPHEAVYSYQLALDGAGPLEMPAMMLHFVTPEEMEKALGLGTEYQDPTPTTPNNVFKFPTRRNDTTH